MVQVRVLPHFRCYLALTRGLFSTRVRDRVDLVEGCSSAYGDWQTERELFGKRWRDGFAEEMVACSGQFFIGALLGDLVFILIGIYGTVAHLRHDLFIKAGRPEIQNPVDANNVRLIFRTVVSPPPPPLSIYNIPRRTSSINAYVCQLE